MDFFDHLVRNGLPAVPSAFYPEAPMRKLPSLRFFLPLLVVPFVAVGCGDTVPSGIQTARLAQREAILREPATADYYVGRRYYNPNYKFWGYIRRPGQPWRAAQLVMLNEKQKLAPDREINQLGVDDNCEYRLYGRFTGDTVYEPASNHLYPEFELKRYELTDRNPASIFPPGQRPEPTTIASPD